jgi:membrane-associated phospholipid phosphatase
MNRLLPLILSVSLLSSMTTSPQLEAQATDSSHTSPSPLLTAKDGWLAAGFVIGTVALFPLDKHLANRIQDPRTQTNHLFQNIATDVRLTAEPGSTFIGVGLYAVGRIGHWQRVADLGLHGTEAIVVGSVVNDAIKIVAGRARPYVVGDSNPHDFQFMRGLRKGDPYSSFPSGHTLAAFAVAAEVTDETTRWWPHSTLYVGTLMYGGATLVALSRMYNNKHWASDVLMAAGIGTFAGRKVFSYQHTHPKNRLDRWLLSANISPMSDGGVALTWSVVPADLDDLRARGSR